MYDYKKSTEVMRQLIQIIKEHDLPLVSGDIDVIHYLIKQLAPFNIKELTKLLGY
jgi:hypothetical protein